MAFFDTTWYVSSVGYAAVTARPQNTAVAAGLVRRQFTAPAVGSERCFVSIVAGTTANVTDATWTLTRGTKTTDGTVTWQECTGAAAMNGDATNTQTWAQLKAAGVPSLGYIIKRNNGASYQICTTAGTLGAAEPSFSDTAGVTTTETSASNVWTSLGAIGSFTGGGAPFARLALAYGTNWAAAPSTVYVASNHAETQATAITFAPISTITTINKVLCHNSSGSYPPASADLTTGATITATSTGSITCTPNGSGTTYFYGLAFKAGVGGASGSITINTTGRWLHFDRCVFELGNAGTGSVIILMGGSGSPGVGVYNNVTVKFGNVAQCVSLDGHGHFLWQGAGQVLVSGSSVPTNFIKTAVVGLTATLEALDLSQLSGNLFASTNDSSFCIVRDCKLHASALVATPAGYNATVQLARSSA